MSVINIVDYGVGNLASVANMIRKVGGEARLISRPDDLAGAEKLLFPGVGAWDTAMASLESRGFVEPLREFAASGKPLLGICLGMQLLFEASEEGRRAGLGLIPGRVRRFDDISLRVPHMGWNVVAPTRPTTLFPTATGEPRFYFAHSYYADASNPEDIAALADYGRRFGCAFERGNVMGTQFHPEKSHRFGMELFSNFLGK